MSGLPQVFELGERLGDGAFAVVHKATHIASGRELAVKIVDKTRLRKTKGSKVGSSLLPRHPILLRIQQSSVILGFVLQLVSLQGHKLYLKKFRTVA